MSKKEVSNSRGSENALGCQCSLLAYRGREARTDKAGIMVAGQKIARTENRRDRNPIGLARQRKMIYSHL